MTKNILEQYSSLLKEQQDIEKRIERLEKRLKRIREGGNVKDAVRGGNGGIQTFKIEGYPTAEDDETAYLLNKNRRILQDRKRKIEETIVEVDKFISSIDDSRMRRMVTYRYIDNMEWQQVAGSMGKRYTADGCRMDMKRFLENL